MGDLLVEATGDVGDDAELALDEHELSAVVHLVFLGAEDAFEAGLGGFSVRLGDGFGEEFKGEGVEPGGKLLALIAQEFEDLGFGARLVFFGFELIDQAEEIVADESVEAFGLVDVIPDASGDGDVREHVCDRATIGSGDETIFGFGKVFGDLKSVFAYRAEGSG